MIFIFGAWCLVLGAWCLVLFNLIFQFESMSFICLHQKFTEQQNIFSEVRYYDMHLRRLEIIFVHFMAKLFPFCH